MAETPVPPIEKTCTFCHSAKPISEYTRSHKSKDGFMHQCKVCWKANLRAYRDKSLTKKTKGRMDIFMQPDEVQQIASAFIESPYAQAGEIATKCKMPLNRVLYFMSRNEYLKAMRALATKKIGSFVPLALKGMKESLISKSPDIKYKSAVEVLKNENILGPMKMDLTVNNLSDLSINQLQGIIERAKTEPIKQTIIEAEVVQ